MRNALALLVGALALNACADDGTHAAPDTQIDTHPDALTNQKATLQFHAIGNFSEFVCSFDGETPAACISPVERDLADGDHTFTVAAALLDFIDLTPAAAQWKLDTVAPETTLGAVPPNPDNNAAPTIAFTGTDDQGAVTFECTIDGGTPAPCTSPFGVSVADGDHAFTVAAVDAAGNRDATPATYGWNVNTTAPQTAIITGPADAATTAASVSFTFSSPDAAATFECSIDGGAFAACTSPKALTLTDGAHTFAVRAVGFGGTDPSPATVTWTVDAIAPTVSIDTNPTNPSNDTTPQFTFSTGETATFECQVDGVTTFAACTTPFEAPSLVDGSKTFRVRATDAVGNVGPVATFTWVIDTAAPTVTINTQPPSNTNDNTPTVTFTPAGNPTLIECAIDGGAFAACTTPFNGAAVLDGPHTISVRVSDAATNSSTATTGTFNVDTVIPTVSIDVEPSANSNDTTPTIQFSTTDNPTVIQCKVDNTTFAPCTSPFTTTVTAVTHTITVRVADAAGNASTDVTAPFVVDTSPPTIAINSQPLALSNDNTPTVTFTPGGNPSTIECQLDGGAFAACTSPFTTTVLDGTHTITVRVTDAATNSASATTSSFKVDTVTPTVTITTEPVSDSTDTTPTIVFTTTDNPTSIQCQVDGSTLANCTSPATLTVVEGTHTITVKVSDGVNSSSDTTAPFTVDLTPPTVAINTQPLALSNDTTPTVTFTPAGNPTKIECTVDNGTFAACTSPFTTTVLDGTHTITVRVTDGAGLTGSATTNSFKVDTVTPTVTITVEPSPDSNDTTPTITFTTTDNPTSIQCQVDGAPLANCSSPATLTVVEGTHTITVKVSDGVNSSSDTTAPFTVDLTPPTVVINSQPAALSNDKTPTVTFTPGGNPTTIECRVDTGTFTACTSPFTTTVADGSHTITVHVVDGAGLQASATTSSFTVDTTSPVVTFDDAPPAQWPVNYFDMKFHANETATFKCSLNGAAFATCSSPITITTPYNLLSSFTVQATDAVGNPGTATTTWTSTEGLVLHYTYEQGGTDNSSLLAQNAAYSPDGDVTAVPFVGGWAGTAAGPSVPVQVFKNTRRPLVSSATPSGGTASFWVRPTNDVDSGTVLSTLTATGGFDVKLGPGASVTVEVRENGQLFTTTSSIGFQKWTQVAVRATSPTKGLELWINGSQTGVALAPTKTGFENTQSNDLTVGPVAFADIDDIRFFNKPLSNEEMCSFLARGAPNPNNGCVALSPGIELDFESNTITDTGAWDLFLSQPTIFDFVNNTKTAGSMFLEESSTWGYLQGGFKANVNAVAGHSFSLWLDAGVVSSSLIDFRNPSCSPNVIGSNCGIAAQYDAINHKLNVFVGTDTNTAGVSSMPMAVGRHGIVVTEQRNAVQTTSITIYIDGKVASIFPVGSGFVYEDISDAVFLVPQANVVVDELEFWTKDLSSDNEALCENGFDGLFVPATGSCLMTSN